MTANTPRALTPADTLELVVVLAEAHAASERLRGRGSLRAAAAQDDLATVESRLEAVLVWLMSRTDRRPTLGRGADGVLALALQRADCEKG